jgi:hypothetical protein
MIASALGLIALLSLGLGCTPSTLILEEPAEPDPDPDPDWIGATDTGGDSEVPDSGDSTWVDTGPVESIPQAADGSDAVFVWDEILEFGIEISDEAYNTLRNDPYNYVEGTFIYGDEVYENVGVRLKGQNSFQPITSKCSFKIKFNEYVEGGRFYGMKRVTLNAMNDDYSMIHERFAYWLYRAVGVPASRATHVWVTVNVNGTDFEYGLYTHLESIDESMIARWYDDIDGVHFEGWDVDFYPNYVSQYQYGFGDEEHGRGVLMDLAQSVQASYEDADPYVDWDQFAKYWAAASIVGQFDAYPYSSPGDDYHIYLESGDDQFDMLPWGNDETFYSIDSNVTSVNGILAKRCKASTTCYQIYKDYVSEMLDVMEDQDMLGLFDEAIEQITPYIAEDNRKIYSDSYIIYYQTYMREFIETRRAKLTSQVGL